MRISKASGPKNPLKVGLNRKKYKRKNRHRKNPMRSDERWHIQDEPGAPYIPRYFEPDLTFSRVAEIRKSSVLSYDKSEQAIRVVIPLIDKRGFITGSVAHRTMMKPSSFVSTLTSTISQRALEWVLRHNGKDWKHARRHKDLIVRYSYLYAVTKSKWLWDRFLFLSKNIVENRKVLHGIHRKFLKRQDDYIRFVHNQCTFQSNWLLFRAKRPRDKSSESRYFRHNTLAKAFMLGGKDCIERALLHTCKCMQMMFSTMFRHTNDSRYNPGAILFLLPRPNRVGV